MRARCTALTVWFFVCILGSSTLAQNPPATSVASSTATPPAASIADALRFYRAGKFDAAIQEYIQLENGPQGALAYVGLARTYLKEEQPAEAYDAVAKANELAPNSADTKVAMGEIYFRQGKIAEAEVEFVDVINSGANSARAYLGLARVSDAASLHHRAKLMIDHAHQIDPADPDVTRRWLGTLTPEERIKALQDYLAQETDSHDQMRTDLERALAVLQGESDIPAHQCRMSSKISSTETDLKDLLSDPNHLRGFGLDVKVNGTSSHLLLDTGAAGILLDRKIAEKAGLKKIVKTDILGIGDRGPVEGYVAQADSIRIGDLQFEDCYVHVVDQNSVAQGDGVIGADVFSHFLVDIDLPNQKLRLSELPLRPDEVAPAAALDAGPATPARFRDRYVAPEMKGYSPIFRFGHMLLVPTKVNNSAAKLFLMDTGAFNNLISPDAAREVTKVSGDSSMQVKGLNGSVKNVYRGDELTLTFGSLRQKNEDIVSFDTKSISDSIGTEVSGTLGFAMLRMLDIKIDYRDGLVYFSFDPKRWR